jgi:hypothetical protein
MACFTVNTCLTTPMWLSSALSCLKFNQLSL